MGWALRVYRRRMRKSDRETFLAAKNLRAEAAVADGVKQGTTESQRHREERERRQRGRDVFESLCLRVSVVRNNRCGGMGSAV
jgi:hypothetical protein